MARLFMSPVLLLLMALPARAADPAPEALLSPTSQLYARWDGVTAHKETYQKSFWGPLMAGPSGDSVRELIAQVPKLFGNNLLAEPLLDGEPPSELKAKLADLKNASRIVDVIADKGVVVGAEVRGPSALKAIGGAIGGLFGDKQPDPIVLMPQATVMVIVPDVGEDAEVLFSTVRLAAPELGFRVVPFEAADRKGFRLVMERNVAQPDRAERSALKVPADEESQPPPPEPEPKDDAVPPAKAGEFQGAVWVEGNHFVLYIGTRTPTSVISSVESNIKKNGVTAHPLFARCTEKQKFTSVSRGFVDAGDIITLVKTLAGAFVPGLNQRIDDLGLGGLKSLVFNCGYEGRSYRAVWELELPGERKGLAKVLKQETFTLKDLPPLPSDVRSFVGVRIDPAAAYNAGVIVTETIAMDESLGNEDESKPPAERIQGRREYLAKEVDRFLGVDVRKELLPCLGDKVVVYQSPNEGLSVFGTVVCVSLKDPAKAKAVADRIHPGLERLLGSPFKVRKKMLKGYEIRELYTRNLGVVVPSYAIVDNWLVVSLYPQGVQGFILRTTGDLPKWKPDPQTLAQLATLPKDGCSIQFCDPKATTKNLCCIGPLFLGAISLSGPFVDRESDFNPIDIGLIPNGHELSKHLLPNLTVIRDDGKTVRLEVNESLSVPLEVIGLEPLIFASFLGFAF